VALLPLYSPTVSTWPDQAYNSAAFFHTIGQSHATNWTLAGGRSDLTPAFLTREFEGPSTTKLAYARARARADEHGRRLTSLYASKQTRHHLRDVATAFTEVANRAVIEDVGVDLQSYIGSLPSAKRGVVRRDLRDLKAAGLASKIEPWGGDLIAEAAPLVAAVHARHFEVDHTALIAERLRQWSYYPKTNCVAFTIRVASELIGASFAWTYGETLELYEMGLSYDLDDNLRHLAYLELMFYAPLRYAWRECLRSLDLAFESERPKRLRGARLEMHYAILF
jgi:hypothetical protein